MENLPKHPGDIQPYSMEQAVVEETAAQLIKDMGEFSFEVVFTGKKESPYRELFDQVLPVVELLMKNNPEMFSALLYRIDVSEKLLREYSRASGGMSFAETVTDLILRREMQKVLTRRYFSR